MADNKNILLLFHIKSWHYYKMFGLAVYEPHTDLSKNHCTSVYTKLQATTLKISKEIFLLGSTFVEKVWSYCKSWNGLFCLSR